MELEEASITRYAPGLPGLLGLIELEEASPRLDPVLLPIDNAQGGLEVQHQSGISCPIHASPQRTELGDCKTHR